MSLPEGNVYGTCMQCNIYGNTYVICMSIMSPPPVLLDRYRMVPTFPLSRFHRVALGDRWHFAAIGMNQDPNYGSLPVVCLLTPFFLGHILYVYIYICVYVYIYMYVYVYIYMYVLDVYIYIYYLAVLIFCSFLSWWDPKVKISHAEFPFTIC